MQIFNTNLIAFSFKLSDTQNTHRNKNIFKTRYLYCKSYLRSCISSIWRRALIYYLKLSCGHLHLHLHLVVGVLIKDGNDIRESTFGWFFNGKFKLNILAKFLRKKMRVWSWKLQIRNLMLAFYFTVHLSSSYEDS